VSVVDAGFDGPQPYLVMDYVEGASLKQLLNADPTRRPPELIIPVLLEALTGLHAAHTLESDDGRPLHIVHCDVSAENLMVGVDGICRLTDFGVARHGEPYRDRQMALGKPACMAPEQLTGGRVDRRADIFAMGVILYNSLTGTTLFASETVEETVRQVCNAPIPPPSTVGMLPPAGFDHICMRALERDPNRRYSTAEEMLTELRRVAIRENLLAAPSMVAEWVRQCVGPELAQRRLSMLDASRRAKAAEPHDSNGGTDQAPFEVADAPSSTIDHGISQTVFLEVGPPRRHWPLMVAGVLAMAVVLTTVLWPGLVSRIFNVKTNSVVSKPLDLEPDSSAPAATGTPSANTTLESPDALRPSRP
jgi:serine/threonine protein kinase